MSPEATLAAGIACSADERRELVLANVQVQGIDYVEVSADQRVLELHFIGEDDPARHAHLDALLDELAQHPERLAIAGGTRVRDVAVVAVARSGHHLEVTVSKPGDFSGYTLRIDPAAGVDPVYSEVRIDFKAGCPARFDCRPGPPPAAALPERPIDYMAKDYASFRQALLDLLPTLIPDWRERLEADLGIVLVELLAYVADQLSYFQDAVANEAYLATARQRVSVRRHARLVDYRMHDGLSARALVHFRVAAPVTIEAGTPLLTRILEPIGSSSAPPGAVLTGLPSEIARARSLADAEFETVDELHADPALNEIELYEWGDADCCLPAGATAADLAGGELAGKLSRGDLLVLEEVLGPETGLTSDADPRHRQAVRITEVEEGGVDTLPDSDVDYVRVHWDAADALAFPLCLSRRSADGTVRGVSVARGNIALALHGRAAEEWHPGDPRLAPGIQPGPRAYRFRLGASPLGFAPPPPRPGTPPRAVTELMAADPREARPRVRLRVLTSDEATRAADGDAVDSPLWTPRRDLLASAPAALDFAVETEDDAGALIRFGRDDFGHAPEQDRYVQVQYRVGAGAAGNVGAEAIAHALAGGPAAAAVAAVRNPVPAFGGVEPEPVAVVREAAPAAFRAEQLRAVTEDDYARAAESSPLVSRPWPRSAGRAAGSRCS